MKRVLFIILLLIANGLWLTAISAEQKPLEKQKWGHVCLGKMPEEWYASEKAQQIAEVVMAIQKTNGGWYKNTQMHKLTEDQLLDLMRKKREHSCLDNYATTQEMRFLAHVYKYNKDERYRQSFLRALEMILTCQKGCGGWSQYWPLTGKGSYQDYITFNDDLMTNVMLILRDVYENEGDFKDLADEATRERCRAAFNRGLDCIIRCQIDDEGVKSVWCAQHDTVAPYLPTEGRPHELPSFCCAESAALLEFLMSVENPSPELQKCISDACAWLDSHKIDNKTLEAYVNQNGEDDRRIIDQPGNALWGRFVQLGGKTAKKTQKLFVICNFCSSCAKHCNEPKAVIANAKAFTITWSHFRGTKNRKILHMLYFLSLTDLLYSAFRIKFLYAELFYLLYLSFTSIFILSTLNNISSLISSRSRVLAWGCRRGSPERCGSRLLLGGRLGLLFRRLQLQRRFQVHLPW